MHDLTTWCERWARARGYWAPDEAPGEPALWWVRPFEGGLLRVCLRDVGGWTLTPLQFWLFALAVDSERSDSQRCPDCATRGGPYGWSQATNNGVWNPPLPVSVRPANGLKTSDVGTHNGPRELRASWPCPTCTGPAVECEVCDGHGRQAKRTADAQWEPMEPSMSNPLYRDAWQCRHCPTCGDGESEAPGTVPGKPLGYTVRPLARVVCEAMPTTLVASCYATEHDAREVAERVIRLAQGRRRNWTPVVWRVRRDVEHDPRGFDEDHGWGIFAGGSAASLEAHADALQAEGNPLATALLLWLHDVPCKGCKGKGQIVIPWSNNKAWAADQPVANDRRPCACCHGDGSALAVFVHEQLKLEAARALDAAKQQLACATTA